ncbi:MAG: molybdopterin molybdotransferase MoeA [Holophagaceae bacterium]
MISIDKALEQLLSSIQLVSAIHPELRSDRDDPAVDKSAMDGYAINTKHTKGTRRIIGTLYAGEDPSIYSLKQNECLKIMTGACIPLGADAVVPIEQCQVEDGSLGLTKGVMPGDFIRKKASHAKKNDLLLLHSHKMNAPRFALYAQVGQVPPPILSPRIVVCSTGDELCDRPSEFQIRDSNWHSLSYLLARLGHVCQQGPILRDNPTQITHFINTEPFDILITTGGVSAGDRDYLPRILKEIGARIIFHKLNLKPGMPMLAAIFNKKIILGLPGNAVSTYVTSLIFLPPLLATLKGMTTTGYWTEGVLQSDVDHSGNKEWIIPALLTDGFLNPHKSRDSSDLVALAQSDVLIRINSPKKKGDVVYYQNIL